MVSSACSTSGTLYWRWRMRHIHLVNRYCIFAGGGEGKEQLELVSLSILMRMGCNVK